MSDYAVSMAQVEAWCRTVARTSEQIETVIAIARGGLVPAALIAAQMPSQPRLVVMRYSSYEDRYQGPVWVADVPGPIYNTPRTLVVDDIVDTGRTLLHFHRYLPRAEFAAVVCKGGMGAVPQLNRWGITRPVGEWVTFPWERSDG